MKNKKAETFIKEKMHFVDIRKFIENSDGSLSYDGDLTIDSIEEDLPFKLNTVYGNFICYGCNFKDLTGFPEIVKGDFSVECCHELESLKGGPLEVGGEYNLLRCSEIKRLYKMPETIKGSVFIIDNDNLENLRGLSKTIEGDLELSGKKIVDDLSLEGVVLSVVYTEIKGKLFSVNFNERILNEKVKEFSHIRKEKEILLEKIKEMNANSSNKSFKEEKPKRRM